MNVNWFILVCELSFDPVLLKHEIAHWLTLYIQQTGEKFSHAALGSFVRHDRKVLFPAHEWMSSLHVKLFHFCEWSNLMGDFFEF